MITLQQITPYLSINLANNIELPDFTVITGVNGSGKTQLLESIEKNISNLLTLITQNQSHIKLN